ncbi:DUF4276 family protein [Algoriphagus sp.]|uniref:DUF4276 family protein n=1 Tax=Algoriphagus sp. TaxID=1872435 RepID=UPI003F72FE61
MRRLVFIVEGDSEIILVNTVIIPYLYRLGFQNPMNAQTIITNRKQHKKGGVTGYGLFRNELIRTLAQGAIVTTLIDFFRLPTDFPGYTTDSGRISALEEAIHIDFDQHPDLIPYIQKHEFEALLFSHIPGFEIVIDDLKQLEQIQSILDMYPNPEDINNSPQTAPSKRLVNIFNYDKTLHSELILDEVKMEDITQKCPRFREWIDRIVGRLQSNN